MKVRRIAAPRENLPKSSTNSQNPPSQKDVKNEGWSQWLIENNKLTHFHDELLKKKEIG